MMRRRRRPPTHQTPSEIVISTEAAHAFVSSAVEKSASRPPPRLGHLDVLLCSFFAFACSFLVLPQGSAVVPAVASKTRRHTIKFKFLEFGPKNTCQVPKPFKSSKKKKIKLAF